jgi:hypothetical protein
VLPHSSVPPLFERAALAGALEACDADPAFGLPHARNADRAHTHEQDTWVERRHIDFLVETLPRARLTVWADSGHGPTPHWGEILKAVTGGLAE